MSNPAMPSKTSQADKPTLFEILSQKPKDGRFPDCFNLPLLQKILIEPEPTFRLTEKETELRIYGTVFNYFHRRFEKENLVNCNAVLLSANLRQWLAAPAKDKSPYAVNNLAWLITKNLSPFDWLYDIRSKKGVEDLYTEMAIRYFITMDLPGDLVPPAAFDYLGEDYPCMAEPKEPSLPLSRGFAHIWRDYIGEVPFDPENATARNSFFMRVLVFMQMTELDTRLFSPKLVAYLNGPLYGCGKDGVAVTGLIYEVFRLAGFAENLKWSEPEFASEMVQRFFNSAFASLILPPIVSDHHIGMAALLGMSIQPKIKLRAGEKARQRYMMEDVPALPVDTTKAKVNIIETGEVFGSFNVITRNLLHGIERSGIPAAYILPLFEPYSRHVREANLENKPWGCINVFSAPLEKLADLMLSHGLQNFNGRYNIGYCNWETSVLPQSRKLGLELLDEVWVATEFQKKIFIAAADKPVHVMPYPVVAAKPDARLGRAFFDISQDAYVFLTSMEVVDWMPRKNILGVIDAFRRAFPDQKENVRLIVKTRYLDKGICSKSNGYMMRIQQNAVEDQRILLFHNDYSDTEMASLYSIADCYVSLHRNSAYGRAVMEAMLQEKPVIVTRGSGCADYTHEQNAALIDAVPCSVVYDTYEHLEYDPRHQWLDPDIAMAAKAMRRMASDRAYAASLGRAGRETILKNYSLEACSQRMRARLETLLQTRTGLAA